MAVAHTTNMKQSKIIGIKETLKIARIINSQTTQEQIEEAIIKSNPRLDNI